MTAASGFEALNLLLEHDVDLVLLDVQMPGMEGFEVARLLRGISCSSRSIRISSNRKSRRCSNTSATAAPCSA